MARFCSCRLLRVREGVVSGLSGESDEPGSPTDGLTGLFLNWFAMDKIAKEQGLMSAFTVTDTGTDEGEWNVLVSVTYMDDKGYEGIAEAFERIRGDHTPVQHTSHPTALSRRRLCADRASVPGRMRAADVARDPVSHWYPTARMRS